MNDLNSVLIEGVVTQPFGFDGESVKPLTVASRDQRGETDRETQVSVILTTKLAGQIGEELREHRCLRIVGKLVWQDSLGLAIEAEHVELRPMRRPK